MGPFTRSWRKLRVVSLLFEIFRRLNAISIAFHTPNATHAVFSSKQAQQFAKCDHLLDFDKNCALFRYCWRYFSVWTLFPLHFARRMLRTPFLASSQAQLCEKCDHILDLEENWALFRYCWRYFAVWMLFPLHFTRRMLRTPFFSVETRPIVQKIRPFMRFRRESERYIAIVEDISTFKRYFHCILHAEHTHVVFSVETCPTVQKMRPFTRSWRKLSAISLFLEMFRRLNAITIAFHAPNATNAIFSVETSTIVRKMRPHTRFWRELSVIRPLLEIFRRLKALSIVFYAPNAMPAILSSIQSELCTKYDHLLDLAENCALYPSCWRYFDV